ncbi:hypothetical protein BKA57DRAFT_453496 [Linnemannia elongata]|nr:hypothetical protein BKA57DRAFT_453496 [Linnemannia elongata]
MPLALLVLCLLPFGPPAPHIYTSTQSPSPIHTSPSACLSLDPFYPHPSSPFPVPLSIPSFLSKCKRPGLDFFPFRFPTPVIPPHPFFHSPGLALFCMCACSNGRSFV